MLGRVRDARPRLLYPGVGQQRAEMTSSASAKARVHACRRTASCTRCFSARSPLTVALLSTGGSGRGGRTLGREPIGEDLLTLSGWLVGVVGVLWAGVLVVG